MKMVFWCPVIGKIPEFENIGFIRGEIFAIFPDVLDALTKLEGANSSENDEAQGRDIERRVAYRG